MRGSGAVTVVPSPDVGSPGETDGEGRAPLPVVPLTRAVLGYGEVMVVPSPDAVTVKVPAALDV